LPLVFGGSYHASVAPFVWLLPSTVGYAALGVFSNALAASGAPGRSSLGPLVAVVVGVALDLGLIPPYGATGAAAAASASFVAGGGVALAAYRRRETFTWSALVVPRRGDLAILGALAPPVARLRPASRGRRA
jgi:O-antigen/teichoic acid export membrane protein